jgi:hypothetical protein
MHGGTAMTRNEVHRSRIKLLSFSLVFAAAAALANCADEESLETSPADWSVDVTPRELAGGIQFAVIGDFGQSGPNELLVADLVKSWTPDFVITTGDNNYPSGAQSTIDLNIGQYYRSFIYPYTGSYGAGSPTKTNRFFPTLGNHDVATSAGKPHLNYFTLPGNERYYDFVRGPVHFFALNSNLSEPSGRSSGSTQALWLKDRLAKSTATWKIVYLHHAPYSSGNHGSQSVLQWPFQAWGATAVLSGHDHHYERIIRDGFPYMVNGLGGKSRYAFKVTVPGSEVRYNADSGAQLVEADDTTLIFKFIDTTGAVIDDYRLMSRSFTNAEDTYIAEHIPGGNFAAASTVKVDGDVPTGTGRDYRGLIRWNIAEIPPGSTVTGVSLTTYVENAAPGEVYQIVEVLHPWKETEATWSDPWVEPGGDAAKDTSSVLFGTISAGTTGPRTAILNNDAVAAVQSWVNDPDSNHGFMIYDADNTDQLELYQSENPTASRRPKLTVTYLPL